MSWDLKWSLEDWLQKLGLARYVEPFIDNGYDLQELCANLKTEDLDAIGVKKEHRKRILAESSTLREEAMARFKKSKGGGSSGSTDHSGSSHGSFPTYTEPWSDEASKHLYSEVWEQPQVDAGVSHGNTPALAQLMLNGGQGQDVADKQKGLTFPPVPPLKSPRKKKLPHSPASQTSFTLPVAPPRPLQGGGAGLNRLQLKLKVLEELQKDRIILSEPPYSKEDGSVNEEKMSELCQTYSERFHIEPAQIMETVRVICNKATDTKVKGLEEADGSNVLLFPKSPVVSSSDIYEEPVDVMRDLTTFKESSPPSKGSKGGQVIATEEIYSEPVDHVSAPSSPQKKGGQMKASPVFLQKPKHSSSENSPEQKRHVSPRSSPRASPHASPATSPREHKRFGLFGKRKTKKAARSSSMKEMDIKLKSKAGKAVLLPGNPPTASTSEGASPSHPQASRKRGATSASLSLDSPPSSTKHSPGITNRTISVSSTSTTGSETSPHAPKKFGIMRFSQRWGSPQRQHKTKTGHRAQDKALTASDVALHRVGLTSEPERQKDAMRNAQSHEHLFDATGSPATLQRTRIESKERGGFLKLFKKRKTGRKKGKSVKGGEVEGEGEGGEIEGERDEEGPSFLTTSTSMPNIASIQLEVTVDQSPSPSLERTNKTSTVPPKPSRRVRIQSPLSIPTLSPDTSPLPRRKVVQSEAVTSGDHLIPITQEREGTGGGAISSWKPTSPSHMLLNPPQGFEPDILSNTTPQESVGGFQERGGLAQRASLSSYNSETSDGVVSRTSTRNSELTGSVESHESSAFGSCSSSNSLPITKSSGGSSMRKPPPPPKPRSLERGKSKAKRSTIPKPPVNEGGERTGKGSGDSDSRDNRGATPPKKPPRPLRGTVKRELVEYISEVTEEERGGEKGGGGEETVVPPPKPTRRYRSVKVGATESVKQERKVQTLPPPSPSSTDRHPGSSRRPVPTPKPRSGLSAVQSKTEPSDSPALSLRDRAAAMLSSERIDLTKPPYSTLWGEWGVPALLISRYAEELDHPVEGIALTLDEIRGQKLKKRNREYIPAKKVDLMKNTAVATNTIPDFLTSVGLPMYSSVFTTQSRGFGSFPNLCALNDTQLQNLNIAPLHRKILLEQLRT